MEHKLGIIGFGTMGEHHARWLNTWKLGMTPAAVFDLREERLTYAREKYGLKTYGNIADFLADGSFDTVVVATSNNTHKFASVSSLEAGYNVICEKPATVNSAELDEIIAVSERVGKFFTVHQNRRFDKDYLVLKKAIASGVFGHIHSIESRIHMQSGDGARFNWRGMADHGGGMLPDWGVHMIDQLIMLIDKPVRSVYAVVKSIYSEEVDDYTKMILNFDGGLSAVMEISDFSPLAMPRFAVFGDRGAGIMPKDDGVMNIRTLSDEHYITDPVYAYTEDGHYYRAQRTHKSDAFADSVITAEGIAEDWSSYYKNILAHLDEGEPLFVQPDEVKRTLRVIEAGYESAKTEEVIRL